MLTGYTRPHRQAIRANQRAACAALGEEELEQPLEDISVGGVPEERALASDVDDVLAFEAIEVMGERRRRRCRARYRYRRQSSPWDARRAAGARCGRRGSAPIAASMSAYCATSWSVGDVIQSSIPIFPQISKYRFSVYPPGVMPEIIGLPDEEFRDSSGPISPQVGYDFLSEVTVLSAEEHTMKRFWLSALSRQRVSLARRHTPITPSPPPIWKTRR